MQHLLTVLYIIYYKFSLKFIWKYAKLKIVCTFQTFTVWVNIYEGIKNLSASSFSKWGTERLQNINGDKSSMGQINGHLHRLR